MFIQYKNLLYRAVIATPILLAGCVSHTENKADLSNLKIACNVYYDTAKGNYEVFVMNADGSDKRNISNAEGIDWVYNAYKDKIYFASDKVGNWYDIYIMKADGSQSRKLKDDWRTEQAPVFVFVPEK